MRNKQYFWKLILFVFGVFIIVALIPSSASAISFSDKEGFNFNGDNNV